MDQKKVASYKMGRVAGIPSCVGKKKRPNWHEKGIQSWRVQAFHSSEHTEIHQTYNPSS